jgi:hypothetical protein
MLRAIRLLPALALLTSAGCLWGDGLPDSPVITHDHRMKVIDATAAAEADIGLARDMVKGDRVVAAMTLLLDRVKNLQTLLYDEHILKSRAYMALDLETAKAYGGLIVDLQRAENGALRMINEPLNRILNRILLGHPDPRRREEAVDAIDGGANEVFIQFKTGYREEIVNSLAVRMRSEENVTVRNKMAAVVAKLSVGPEDQP